MTLPKALGYTQGVMVLEGLETARAPSPMTDQAGMRKYQAAMQSQLDGIFGMMFPKTAHYQENVEIAADAAKSRLSHLNEVFGNK